MYAMTPSTWAKIEPCYAEKWTCIVEYRDREATPDEYERVKEVMKELGIEYVEANLPDPDISGIDFGEGEVNLDGYFQS